VSICKNRRSRRRVNRVQGSRISASYGAVIRELPRSHAPFAPAAWSDPTTTRLPQKRSPMDSPVCSRFEAGWGGGTPRLTSANIIKQSRSLQLHSRFRSPTRRKYLRWAGRTQVFYNHCSVILSTLPPARNFSNGSFIQVGPRYHRLPGLA
jgi:hypothetical protein